MFYAQESRYTVLHVVVEFGIIACDCMCLQIMIRSVS